MKAAWSVTIQACAVVASSRRLASSNSDDSISSSSISSGGIIALVLLIFFSLVLLGSCVYQSKTRPNAENAHRILRCAGCRRAFRVPAAVENAEFMCSRCVSEGRRRMSDVETEEREQRLERMKNAAKRTVQLTRVTSTFFRVTSGSFLEKSNTKKFATPEGSTTGDPTPAGSDIGESSKECKICFDDDSCIVLLPCGHGGLCEGCAKDLVTHGKECYICRGEIDVIAKVRPPRRDMPLEGGDALSPAAGLALAEEGYACRVIAPDSLHHLSSRVMEPSHSRSSHALTVPESVPENSAVLAHDVVPESGDMVLVNEVAIVTPSPEAEEAQPPQEDLEAQPAAISSA